MTPTISVCLCTYRRPQLKQTLDSLQQQKLPPGMAMEISIADNDADGSARSIVDDFRKNTTFKVHYHIQPKKGISNARNTSVSNARGEWLAFLDDDEIAEPNWLSALIQCAKDHDAQVVLGHVNTCYPKGTPSWIVEGSYFDKPLPETGTPMMVGSTCNALIHRAALPHSQAPFDLAFGTTGGEDTALFYRMHQQGIRMVACRKAIVSETVEKDRLNREYLMRKATRIGETYAVVFFSSLSLPAKLWNCTSAGAKALLAGILALFWSLLSPNKNIRYLMKMRSNWGKVRFFFNAPPVQIYK